MTTINLGERGVLFVLMDHYVDSVFPLIGEKGRIGGATNEGILITLIWLLALRRV